VDIPSLAEKGERFHGITCELNLRLQLLIVVEHINLAQDTDCCSHRQGSFLASTMEEVNYGE